MNEIFARPEPTLGQIMALDNITLQMNQQFQPQFPTLPHTVHETGGFYGRLDDPDVNSNTQSLRRDPLLRYRTKRNSK